jgi:hypothetical protein
LLFKIISNFSSDKNYIFPNNISFLDRVSSDSNNNNNIVQLEKKFLNNICSYLKEKHHYNDKDLDNNKDKPLYKTFQVYDTSDFEIFIEEELYGKDIGLINIKEGEYMKKYNSLIPNGYNIEEVGKKYPKILKDLADLYKFEIKKYEYVDSTRERRVKDICIGKYFGFSLRKINLNEALKYLEKIEIDKVTLTESNGLRILVKPKTEKNNIRIYFHGNQEKCIEYAKKISNNVIITSKFYGNTYKYQDKLDKVLKDKNIITTLTGNSYYNNSRKCSTYLIMISGNKNKRTQTLHRISFGGKSIDLKDSYKTALEFIDKIKIIIPSIKYIINEPCL